MADHEHFCNEIQHLRQSILPFQSTFVDFTEPERDITLLVVTPQIHALRHMRNNHSMNYAL